MKVILCLCLLFFLTTLTECDEKSGKSFAPKPRPSKVYRGKVKFLGIADDDENDHDDHNQDDNDDDDHKKGDDGDDDYNGHKIDDSDHKDDNDNDGHRDDDDNHDNDRDHDNDKDHDNDGDHDNDRDHDDDDADDNKSSDYGKRPHVSHYQSKHRILVKVRVPAKSLTRNQVVGTIASSSDHYRGKSISQQSGGSAQQVLGSIASSDHYRGKSISQQSAGLAQQVLGTIAAPSASYSQQSVGQQSNGSGKQQSHQYTKSIYGQQAAGAGNQNNHQYTKSIYGQSTAVGQVSVTPANIILVSPASFQPTKIHQQKQQVLSSVDQPAAAPTAPQSVIAPAVDQPKRVVQAQIIPVRLITKVASVTQAPLRVTSAPGATQAPFRASPIKAYAGSHVRPVSEILKEIQYSQGKRPEVDKPKIQHVFRPYRPSPVQNPETVTKTLSTFEATKVSKPAPTVQVKQVKVVPVVKVYRPAIVVSSTPRPVSPTTITTIFHPKPTIVPTTYAPVIKVQQPVRVPTTYAPVVNVVKVQQPVQVTFIQAVKPQPKPVYTTSKVLSQGEVSYGTKISKPTITLVKHPLPTPKPATKIYVTSTQQPAKTYIQYQVPVAKPSPPTYVASTVRPIITHIQHPAPTPKPATKVYVTSVQQPTKTYVQYPVPVAKPFPPTYVASTVKPVITHVQHPAPTPKPATKVYVTQVQQPAKTYVQYPVPVAKPSPPVYVTSSVKPIVTHVQHPAPQPKPAPPTYVTSTQRPYYYPIAITPVYAVKPVVAPAPVPPPAPKPVFINVPTRKPAILHIDHPKPTPKPQVVQVSVTPIYNIPVATPKPQIQVPLPQPPQRPQVVHHHHYEEQKPQPETQTSVLSEVAKPPTRPVVISVSVDHSRPAVAPTQAPVVIAPSQPLPPLRPVPTAPPAVSQVEHHPPKGARQPAVHQFFFESFSSVPFKPAVAPPATKKEVLSEIGPPKPQPGPSHKPATPCTHCPPIQFVPVYAVSSVRPPIAVQPPPPPPPKPKPAPQPIPVEGFIIHNIRPHVKPQPPVQTVQVVKPQVVAPPQVAAPPPPTHHKQYFIGVPVIPMQQPTASQSKPAPPQKEAAPIIPADRPYFNPITVSVKPVITTIHHHGAGHKQKEVKEEKKEVVQPNFGQKTHHVQQIVPTYQLMPFYFGQIGPQQTTAVLPETDKKPEGDDDDDDDDHKEDDGDHDDDNGHKEDDDHGDDDNDHDDGGYEENRSQVLSPVENQKPSPPPQPIGPPQQPIVPFQPQFMPQQQFFPQQQPQFIPQQQPQFIPQQQPQFIPQQQPQFVPQQPPMVFQQQFPQLDVRQFQGNNFGFLQPKPTINPSHHPNAHMKSSERERIARGFNPFPPLIPNQFNVPTQTLLRNIRQFHRN